MKSVTVLAALLSALAVSAQQPQPGVTAPTPQEQSQDASGAQPQSQPGTPGAGAEASPDELKVTEEEAQKEVTDANKASNIIGMKVVNRQNEDLGKIKDIVVDLESGKVAYVVMSAGGGGFFGMGGKLVAVPVSALTPRDGQEGFVMDADKQRLDQAQGFSEQDWPAIDAAEQKTVGLVPEPTQEPTGNAANRGWDDRTRDSAKDGNEEKAGAKNERQTLDPNRTTERDR